MRIARKAIIPLYLNFKGKKRWQYAKCIRQSHAWSLEEAKRVQVQKLADTLRYCLQNIPFYRDRVELEPGEITPENAETALLQFPVLTSDLVKKHFEELQVQPRPKGAFLNRSGGTTGLPTVFYLDKESEAWVRGTKIYHEEVCDHRLGEKKWVIWGVLHEEKNILEKAKKRSFGWIFNTKRFQGFSLSNAELDKLLDGIQKESPTMILAYADILDRLAERALETGREMPPSINMKVSAGTLYPRMRARIERAFGPRLFNCYGSREFGDIALSCMWKRGLHIQGLAFYVEAVDDREQRLPMGETGELLITTMVNRTMPLIRYKIGDRGSLSDASCACGNPWTRIQQVEGRSQDLFYAKDGRKISPNALVHFCWIYGMEYQTRVQIIQTDYDRMEVHLLDTGSRPVPREGFEAETRAEIEELFQYPVQVKILWKKELAYAPSGKFRMIQRRISE